MWRDTPLIYIVLEKLRKINGTIRDEDLYKEVKKDVNYEFSFSDFLKALMALEIRGVISVSLIRENTRMVTYLGEKE
ncbi:MULTISPECIES: hypothetical protein [Metallosphaera]|uniref:Uncharacterized protein n=3 Tax=Metallosphaera TaxID=41980 RepID=A4YD86_METS5|nr:MULTISPECIES: hypothetical protein [Metallosphaera]ABP94388.1 hypothetical protein Msed_0211 [Metallosphaera sedula DSM 5348]AIM26375.1 hypothetical protein HA72_0211 [Metallosphaera sedula]AKV73381.1 hypothetical protein MsedA_0221 [Metallosphaera sedula]AKV75625.1 hypothetical protein MsedB_0221 [Metallosphaera sedula]AKV77871.1 hypothetical protein MsedC_0220 [Metallosphaera sedula]